MSVHKYNHNYPQILSPPIGYAVLTEDNSIMCTFKTAENVSVQQWNNSNKNTKDNKKTLHIAHRIKMILLF